MNWTFRDVSQANTAQERMAGEASASDDWELDPADLEFHEKINSGAFGDLYRGSFCGQDVAIKILRNVQNDSAQYSEFLQASSLCYIYPRSCDFFT